MRHPNIRPESLFVVETSCGSVFGGLASSPWVVPKGVDAGCFFGRQGFLFKINKSTGEHLVWNWTGFNSYCQLLVEESGSVAMGGGGEEGFGFRCSDDFSVCTSSKSMTFGNEPLISNGSYADVVDVECWGFRVR